MLIVYPVVKIFGKQFIGCIILMFFFAWRKLFHVLKKKYYSLTDGYLEIIILIQILKNYSFTTASENYSFNPDSKNYNFNPDSENYSFNSNSKNYSFNPSSENYSFIPDFGNYNFNPDSENYSFTSASINYNFIQINK